jgi:hypothetical protein
VVDAKRSLEQRLKDTAIVAQDAQHPDTLRDLREMTRILIRGLLAAVVQLRQGTYGTDVLADETTVALIVEEQRAMAEWAVREVRNHLAQWGTPGQADAYMDEAEAPLAREALEAYATALRDEAEAAALTEAQTWGRAETRAAEIETILALKHRQN